MLQLLSVLQNGRTWSGAELAACLGTSPRTLRRDIDRLRELGYPVQSARGVGGSYQLVAGRAMPPLVLTDEEALATVIGLRFATLTHIEGVAPNAQGALDKLERVLPTRLRRQMEAISTSVELAARTGLSADLGLLQQLASSAYEHLEVEFDYSDSAGRTAHRRVQPYRQVLMAGNWFLLGWDRDRGDWRSYRLDRMSRLSVPGSTFLARELPADGPVSLLRRPVTVNETFGRIRFAAPIEVVSGRLAAQAGSLESIDEETCRYSCAPDSWEWLAMTVAAVGVPYVIEGPPELRAHTELLAERISAAARPR
ncbi:MAG: YafY family protein [Nakamurella sp.]